MLEKMAWRYLARRMEVHRKAGRHHEADHIRAALATRPQKQCVLCCIMENTDWLAWASRFDPSFNESKDEELYGSATSNASRFRDVVRRSGLD